MYAGALPTKYNRSLFTSISYGKFNMIRRMLEHSVTRLVQYFFNHELLKESLPPNAHFLNRAKPIYLQQRRGFLRKCPTKNLHRDNKIAFSTAIRPSFAKIGLKKNLPSSRTPFLKNGDSSWNQEYIWAQIIHVHEQVNCRNKFGLPSQIIFLI